MHPALIAFWLLCAGGALLVGIDLGVLWAVAGLVLGVLLGPIGLGILLFVEQKTRVYDPLNQPFVPREEPTPAPPRSSHMDL